MKRFAAVMIVLSLGACGDAGEPRISASSGWAREIAPGQTAAAAYVTIVNQGDGADQLTGAASAAAAAATLHSSSSAGGVVRMRAIADGVAIPARSTIGFEPGGNHIMLTGLKKPLRAGQTIELTLMFAKSAKQQVAIRILPATATDGAAHGMGM